MALRARQHHRACFLQAGRCFYHLACRRSGRLEEVLSERCDCCGFIKPPGTNREWLIKKHGAFKNDRSALGLSAVVQTGHSRPDSIRCMLKHRITAGQRAVVRCSLMAPDALTKAAKEEGSWALQCAASTCMLSWTSSRDWLSTLLNSSSVIAEDSAHMVSLYACFGSRCTCDRRCFSPRLVVHVLC